ncbi:MAG: GNAT family N-acetyltransferase [Bacillota bacterium]
MEKDMQLPDIYFNEAYGHLYEKLECGIFNAHHFRCKFGEIYHPFICRVIPGTQEAPEYDLITPYGYGGPIVLEATDRDALVHAYGRHMDDYCAKNRIVSEFVRFHPLLKNSRDFASLYDVAYNRKTVCMNLLGGPEAFISSLKKNIKHNYHKALKREVTIQIVEQPDHLDDFKQLYSMTMDRNHAQEYYYFADEYFSQMLRTLGPNLLLTLAYYQGTVVGALLCFRWQNRLLHGHLIGTDEKYLSSLGLSVLLYIETALWGSAHGFELFHLGGGLSGDPEDTLFQSKSRFLNMEPMEFYTGRKIWNNDRYERLCAQANADMTQPYFPAYRSAT